MICGPNDVQAISENLSLPANIVCAEDLLTRVFFISFSFSIKSALHPLLTHTPSVCQPSINIVRFHLSVMSIPLSLFLSDDTVSQMTNRLA